MATWPNSLPQNPSSVSQTIQSNILTTDMSTGYSKKRRRYTKKYKIYNLTYEMSLEQYYSFELFFNGDLGYGEVEFDLPDPLKIDTTITVRFVQDEGQDPYSITALGDGDTVIVSFSVDEL